TTWIPAGKRLADGEPRRIKRSTRLCLGHRPAAQRYRSHSQSQRKAPHFGLRCAIPGHIRSISVLLKPESAQVVAVDALRARPRESVANAGWVGRRYVDLKRT